MEAVGAVPGRTADYTLPKTYPKAPQNAWAGRQKSSGSHDSDSPPDRRLPQGAMFEMRLGTVGTVHPHFPRQSVVVFWGPTDCTVRLSARLLLFIPPMFLITLIQIDLD